MRAAILALVSAAPFGASTPFAKQFLAAAHPVVVAGLLYLGSGVGLLRTTAVTPPGGDWGRRPGP